MKVLDLASDVGGRFAGKLLAMSGLRVVRPGDSRQAIPDEKTPDPVAVYLDAYRETVSCDGTDALSALVEGEDLVLLSFDRGRYAGLVSEAWVERLPATCIQVTTSTFGTFGPYSTFRGGPLADWAAGGYLAITGEPDREPLIGPENLCGYITGYTAAIAAEAALRHRRLTGIGARVDVCAMEAMLSVHQSTFSRLAAGIVRERTGRYTEVYPLVVRPCRQGYVSLGVVTDAEFDRLAIALGREDLLTDPRFCDKNARWDYRDELDAEFDRFLGVHDAEQVVGILEQHGVAVARVAGASDVLENPQLAYRSFWDCPYGPDRAARMPGNPLPAAKRSSHRARSTYESAAGSTDAVSLPLNDVVVLDFTAFWAGPSATRWLADLGARVIWVERPNSRTDVSSRTTDTSALVQHLFHLKMNRNKQSVVLDLEDPADRYVAHQLATDADVLIENFRPGVMDRLGLGPLELCRSYPRLVYVSLSGFGWSGPWSGRRSYGPSIEAASSIEGRTGYPGGEPLRLGHTLPDGTAGLAGALAALRGLRERAESGTGGWFDLSQLEAYTAMSGEDLLLASISGQQLPRIGNRSRYGAIQGVYPCRGHDEWIAIRLVDQHDLSQLEKATGLSGLPSALPASPSDHDVIDARISSYTLNHDKHELTARLQNAGVEAFAVLKPPELVADGHLRRHGFLLEVPFEDSRVALPGSPLHADPPLVNPHGPAPGFGEHTSTVLRGIDVRAGGVAQWDSID
jgi:crotonobetainyl-CoA:carnitine CoA-transferase CaiB-like acyl-CoA transferase